MKKISLALSVIILLFVISCDGCGKRAKSPESRTNKLAAKISQLVDGEVDEVIGSTSSEESFVLFGAYLQLNDFSTLDLTDEVKHELVDLSKTNDQYSLVLISDNHVKEFTYFNYGKIRCRDPILIKGNPYTLKKIAANGDVLITNGSTEIKCN